MKLLFGLILFGWLVFSEISKLHLEIMSIVTLLGILCLFIFKEKFFDNTYTNAAMFLLILTLSTIDNQLLLLLAIPILHFFYTKKYFLSFVTAIISIILVITFEHSYFGLLFIITGLFGYSLGEQKDNEKNYTIGIDEERRLRYRLEETQNKLLHSRREIEHLTEIRERNRIAHEIHDNVGHCITGVIFQIEAARRIISKDPTKLEQILKLCSGKLAEALQLTRNTVYNIKVNKKVGKDLLEKLVQDFHFCPIEYEFTGDFNTVSVTNLKVLETLIMESLTNASKYSQAKLIQLTISIGKKNIRFYYKDNGVGCSNIRESLGILGMREEVENIGGIISIDGNNGFLIVCHLPIIEEDGD